MLDKGVEMDRQPVKLTYSGPAVEAGKMDLALVGPALVAFHGLILEANSILNDDRAKIQIDVQGFREGSFSAYLDLAQGFWDQATTLLTGKSVASILVITEVLGLVTGRNISLIGLLLKFKGESPKDVRTDEHGNTVLVGDGVEYPIDEQLKKLLASDKLAKYLAGLTAPLLSDGVDSLDVTVGMQASISFKKEHAQILSRRVSPVEHISSQTDRVTIGIKKITIPVSERAYNEFTMGEFKFQAKITHKEFVEANRGGPFSVEDHLDVDLAKRELKVGDQVSYEYEIVRVHRLIPGPKQSSFA